MAIRTKAIPNLTRILFIALPLQCFIKIELEIVVMIITHSNDNVNEMNWGAK